MIYSISEIYRGIDLQSKLVCPEFAAFEFTNWNKGEVSEDDRCEPLCCCGKFGQYKMTQKN